MARDRRLRGTDARDCAGRAAPWCGTGLQRVHVRRCCTGVLRDCQSHGIKEQHLLGPASPLYGGGIFVQIFFMHVYKRKILKKKYIFKFNSWILPIRLRYKLSLTY
uniref:Uncharacterized protein n=1 Tax=Oryza rufipogon TaxID=4529 RepID=A0A0E0PW21_ORYRU